MQMERKVRRCIKKKEVRILGTMLFQALFLGICVVLYKHWEWSHFDSTWESGLFYFLVAFVFQGACYFAYKLLYERKEKQEREEALKQRMMQNAKAQETYMEQTMRLMNAMMASKPTTSTRTRESMNLRCSQSTKTNVAGTTIRSL